MKISALPLEAILYKLNAGFNDALLAVAVPTYGVEPFRLTFPNSIYAANSPNFFFGQIAPEDIARFGVSEATKAVLFTINSSNANFEKPRDFAGPIQVALDFHLVWKSSDTRQNFEAMSLAVEDAVTECLQATTVQNWGAGVVYNGVYQCIRGRLYVPEEKGQGSFQQTVAFRFGFQVHV